MTRGVFTKTQKEWNDRKDPTVADALVRASDYLLILLNE